MTWTSIATSTPSPSPSLGRTCEETPSILLSPFKLAITPYIQKVADNESDQMYFHAMLLNKPDFGCISLGFLLRKEEGKEETESVSDSMSIGASSEVSLHHGIFNFFNFRSSLLPLSLSSLNSFPPPSFLSSPPPSLPLPRPPQARLTWSRLTSAMNGRPPLSPLSKRREMSLSGASRETPSIFPPFLS